MLRDLSSTSITLGVVGSKLNEYWACSHEPPESLSSSGSPVVSESFPSDSALLSSVVVPSSSDVSSDVLPSESVSSPRPAPAEPVICWPSEQPLRPRTTQIDVSNLWYFHIPVPLL